MRAYRFLDELTHLGAADLESVSFALTMADGLDGTRVNAVAIATRSGLRPLLDEIRTAARDIVVEAYAADGFQPTWFGLNWGRSAGTTVDRVTIVEVVEDAAIATVARDVIDPGSVDRLRQRYDLLASMHPVRDPAADPTRPRSRIERWSRPITIVLLLSFVGFIAAGAGAYGLLAVAIPMLIAAVIIARLARESRPH